MFTTSYPRQSQPRFASPKQIAFLTTLVRERDQSVIAGGPLTDEGETFSMLDANSASQMITALLALPKKGAAVAAAPLEVGMYRNDAGEIFKVQESATGNRYAKKLVPIGGQRLTESDDSVRFEFEYAPGAIKSLTAAQRLTLDEAKAFGIKYGVCCVCNRTLKDAKSVALGIGPVCITKL
jgi:hypothetical protein